MEESFEEANPLTNTNPIPTAPGLPAMDQTQIITLATQAAVMAIQPQLEQLKAMLEKKEAPAKEKGLSTLELSIMADTLKTLDNKPQDHVIRLSEQHEEVPPELLVQAQEKQQENERIAKTVATIVAKTKGLATPILGKSIARPASIFQALDHQEKNQNAVIRDQIKFNHRLHRVTYLEVQLFIQALKSHFALGTIGETVYPFRFLSEASKNIVIEAMTRNSGMMGTQQYAHWQHAAPDYEHSELDKHVMDNITHDRALEWINFALLCSKKEVAEDTIVQYMDRFMPEHIDHLHDLAKSLSKFNILVRYLIEVIPQLEWSTGFAIMALNN